jgi:hypothetical protein
MVVAVNITEHLRGDIDGEEIVAGKLAAISGS